MEYLVRSLSQVCVVIGTQWGDKGKGNIVHILAQCYDIMVCCQGGANAGHTIYNFVLDFSILKIILYWISQLNQGT